MKQVVISAPPLEAGCEGPIHLRSDPDGLVFEAVCLSCGGHLDRDLADRLHELLEARVTSAGTTDERPLA